MTELPKTIDELEDAVEEMEVPHIRLILEFRNFLDSIINEKKLQDIVVGKLELLSKYLSKDTLLSAQKDDEIRAQLNLELAHLADENKADVRYYSFIRCLRLIYVDKTEWERTAQDTLLFSFFFHTKRIFSDIEPEFVKYFSHALFDK